MLGVVDGVEGAWGAFRFFYIRPFNIALTFLPRTVWLYPPSSTANILLLHLLVAASLASVPIVW